MIESNLTLEVKRLSETISKQKSYFNSGETRSLKFRIAQLKKLSKAIEKWEHKILEALYTDLGKSSSESYITEVEYAQIELRHTIKMLPRWYRDTYVPTPILMKPGKSRIVRDPYGRVLIIGPWNYPFQLIMLPLIGAISGGNTITVKPSELAPATAQVIESLLSDTFDDAYISVFQGGVDFSTVLLEKKWDHIFFTGSTHVGRIVYEAAAKHLTPVVLELGGKCPAIVDKDIDIEKTASRIIWGKYMNCGQTCLAPDYLLVHRDIQERLVEKLIQVIERFYTSDPESMEDYGRIINTKNYDRLVAMIEEDKIRYGGQKNRSTKYLGPVLMEGVTLEDPVMREEIFGPILPILTIDSIDEAIDIVNQGEKPLASYIFTKSKKVAERLLTETSSGGVSINDILFHHNNRAMPFGGVGESGIGGYQGKHSYETFTHAKSVYHNTFLVDPSLRYPPYRKNISLLRKALRWFS